MSKNVNTWHKLVLLIHIDGSFYGLLACWNLSLRSILMIIMLFLLSADSNTYTWHWIESVFQILYKT